MSATALEQVLRTLAAGRADTAPLTERLGGRPAEAARPLFDRGFDSRDLAAVRQHPEVHGELERARAEAEAAARAEVDAELGELRQRYTGAVEALAEAARALPRIAADDVADLALAIAGEIARAQIAVDRDRLRALIDESLTALADDDGPLTVRMCAADHAAVGALEGPVRTVADSGLRPGDLVIESPHAMVDATVDGALARLRGPLIELLERGEDAE